ncbi:hypothetical protein ACFYUK_47395 [Nonomuraea wenchangensis]
MRHLETASVDDALDVLDLLISSNLLARAERAGEAEQLRTFPRLRRAARTMASATEVLMAVPEATEEPAGARLPDAHGRAAGKAPPP